MYLRIILFLEPEWTLSEIAHEAEGKNKFSLQNAIQPPLVWFSKPALFATSGL